MSSFILISRKPFVKGFFPFFFFLSFCLDFFPPSEVPKCSFSEKIEKFHQKSKNLWHFFRFFGIISHFFSRILTLIFFQGQTVRNCNFPKETEKIHLKFKILCWFFHFSNFVNGAVTYSQPLKIFLPYNLHSFRWLLKKEFLKNSHHLSRYQLYAKINATDFSSHGSPEDFTKPVRILIRYF